MTVNFIDDRICELRRVADALIAEEGACDLKSALAHQAIFNIERAIADLMEAKTGVVRAN